MSNMDFLRAKAEGRKLSMVTCYDYTFARLLSKSPIDGILVGDSAAMVMQGHPSTLSASTELMRLHTEAVVRGAAGKFIVADMPFLSFRKGPASALDSASVLMVAGAHAVKLEGVDGHEDVIQRMVQSGIPVMGHVGLQPQSVRAYGGFRVQGRAATRREISPGRRPLSRNLGRLRSCSRACQRTLPGKLVKAFVFRPSASAPARDVTDRYWCFRICWA